LKLFTTAKPWPTGHRASRVWIEALCARCYRAIRDVVALVR